MSHSDPYGDYESGMAAASQAADAFWKERAEQAERAFRETVMRAERAEARVAELESYEHWDRHKWEEKPAAWMRIVTGGGILYNEEWRHDTPPGGEWVGWTPVYRKVAFR